MVRRNRERRRINPGLEEVEHCIDLVSDKRVSDWGTLTGIVEGGVRHYLEHELHVTFVGFSTAGWKKSNDAFFRELNTPIQSAIASHLSALRRISGIVSESPFTERNTYDYIQAVGMQLPGVVASLQRDGRTVLKRLTKELNVARRRAEDRRTMDAKQRALFEKAREFLNEAEGSSPAKRPMKHIDALEKANADLQYLTRDAWLSESDTLRVRFRKWKHDQHPA